MRTFFLFLSGAALGGVIYLLNKDKVESNMMSGNEGLANEDNIGSSRKSTKGRSLETLNKRTDRLDADMAEGESEMISHGLTNESRTGNVD
jgi:hypothetical protein